MEIIQASGSYRASLHPQFSPISSDLHLHPRLNLSVKSTATLRSGNKLISTSTTRAILGNSTSDTVATKTVNDDQLLAIKKKASEISIDLRGASIFLIGMNSSYKSSLGRILAEALRYYYFDSDGLVEEAAGGKAAALSYIEKDAEEYFSSETEVLKQLSSMGRLVVCAGNGAVKSATNLALLRHGISIMVDVPLDLVARDIMEDRIQLSASDESMCKSSEVLDQLTTLYNSARSGYSTADATISVPKVASELGYEELDEVTTEDLCMEVLKEIEKLVRVKKMIEEAARPF